MHALHLLCENNVTHNGYVIIQSNGKCIMRTASENTPTTTKLLAEMNDSSTCRRVQDCSQHHWSVMVAFCVEKCECQYDHMGKNKLQTDYDYTI